MLQFGHGTRPWNSANLGCCQPARFPASIRPRHEAVEFPPLPLPVLIVLVALLQFGHGTRPWNSAQTNNIATAGFMLQFGHGTRPWNSLTTGATGVGGAIASIRPRHEAVEFPMFPETDYRVMDSASIRPRHEAVEFHNFRAPRLRGPAGFNSATARGRGIPKRARTCYPGPRRFNSATARGRGIPDSRRVRSRLAKVLQFGHGTRPWNSSAGSCRCRDGTWGCFNSATARGRGIPDLLRLRDVRPTGLQFGHGTRPWNSLMPLPLVQVQPVWLQFGHGTRPWNSEIPVVCLLLRDEASIRPRHEAVEFPPASPTLVSP